jgi:beta-galactosidase
LVLFAGAVGSAGPREVSSLDFDWRFHRGDITGVVYHDNSPGSASPVLSPFSPAFDDASWETVQLPHDYVFQAAPSDKANVEHGAFPLVPGWYRRLIDIPESGRGRRLWLEFDGVYRDSLMWLNGKFLGEHQSGYTSFRYDISDVAQPGRTNLLVVRVDPTKLEGWWYEGGGIYRHVRLVSLAPVHVAPWGVHVVAEVRDPGDGAQAPALVNIATRLQNESAADAQVGLLSEILDPTGMVVAQQRGECRLAAGASDDLQQSIALPRANLWSCEHPYLYRLRTTVSLAAQVVDQTTTRFGVRTFRFDPDRGFFLNGRPLRIKGTCNHQDFAGIGIALPDAIHEFRLRKLMELGANACRLSHHQMAPEWLEACDRLGLLVVAENRHLGDSPEILSQLDTLIRRDRNHPSVILWCISNEEREQGSALGAGQGRAMKQLIQRLDPTRPITAAMNNGFGGGLTGVIDVQGFNYHPDQYDGFHARFPKLPVIATEIAAAVGTRGVYLRQPFKKDGAHFEGDPARCHLSAYGVNALVWSQPAEVAWRAVADRPWLSGAFVWSGFDYRGEPTPFDWPATGTQYGLMDQCGFPKDGFYYFQSWWGEAPVLHIFPHWNWPGREGKDVDVWVYSNCEAVELFLNDQSLGVQAIPRNGHLEWTVKYAPGRLAARGRRNGATVTAEVATTGAAAAIRLEANRTTLTADGQDVALVTVRIVDAEGRTVPTATNHVEFTVTGEGRLLGVANGDPASHEPDHASRRRAFNGLCLGILQAARTGGTIGLKAESPGLTTATLSCQTVAPQFP